MGRLGWLRPVVDDCWLSHAATARARGLVFRNEVPVDAAFQTDGEGVRQILSNLLSNAVRYTAQGGVIKVGPSRADDVVVLEVYDRATYSGDLDAARVRPVCSW